MSEGTIVEGYVQQGKSQRERNVYTLPQNLQITSMPPLEDVRHEEAKGAEIERLLREIAFRALSMGFDVCRKQGQFKYKDVLEGDMGVK